MKSRKFFLPRLIFGEGVVESLGGEVSRLGAKKVAMICSASSVRNGFVERTTSSLAKHGIQTHVISYVEPEPSVATAERALRETVQERCDAVIGLGGGSPMDVAKAVALASTNGGLENCYGINKAARRALPLLLVPTTAGTGSEATNVSVLNDVSGKKAVIYSNFLFPDVAIVDPLLTVPMPREITAYTGLDALAHAVEAYMSVNGCAESDMAALKAVKLVVQNIEKAVANGGDIEARHNMCLGAFLAGAALANAGIEVDGCPLAGAGIAHAIGLATGAKYRIPHGLAVGMALPESMAWNLPSLPQKAERMANIFDSGDPVEGVQQIIKRLNIETRLAHFGAKAEDIPRLTETAMAAQRLLANCARLLEVANMAKMIRNIL